jgi:hypothetical protein
MNKSAFIAYLFILGFTKTDNITWTNNKYIVVIFEVGLRIKHNDNIKRTKHFHHYDQAQRYIDWLLEK